MSAMNMKKIVAMLLLMMCIVFVTVKADDDDDDDKEKRPVYHQCFKDCKDKCNAEGYGDIFCETKCNKPCSWEQTKHNWGEGFRAVKDVKNYVTSKVSGESHPRSNMGYMLLMFPLAGFLVFLR